MFWEEYKKICRNSELNQGHRDFQSLALPTELLRHTLIINLSSELVEQALQKSILRSAALHLRELLRHILFINLSSELVEQALQKSILRSAALHSGSYCGILYLLTCHLAYYPIVTRQKLFYAPRCHNMYCG